MIQRKPEVRLCPLMNGQTCMATKCMMYHEEPSSTVACCNLAAVGSLGDISIQLKDLSLSLAGLKLTVEKTERSLPR